MLSPKEVEKGRGRLSSLFLKPQRGGRAADPTVESGLHLRQGKPLKGPQDLYSPQGHCRLGPSKFQWCNHFPARPPFCLGNGGIAAPPWSLF